VLLKCQVLNPSYSRLTYDKLVTGLEYATLPVRKLVGL
jgi:hypothetical protein